MTPLRRAERATHEELRDAIRRAALVQWDCRIDEDEDDESKDLLRETRPEVESGVLVDYVVVAVFDSGSDDHDVKSVLRTDGRCAAYRVHGLLSIAQADL